MTYETLVSYLLIVGMTILSITLLCTLVRVIIGPKVADRLLGVNMIGTQVMILISFIAIYLHQDGLMDIGIIYALLSFLSVVILTNLYTRNYSERANSAKGGKR